MTRLLARGWGILLSVFASPFLLLWSSLAFGVPAAGTADVAGSLVGRVQYLSGLLQNPETRLSDEQRHELKLLIDSAVAITGRASGAAGPGSCYNEAYKYLSRDDALLLCEGGGDSETAHCFVQAKDVMAKEQAVRLCKDRGTSRTFVCYQTAHRHLSVDGSVSLCAMRGTEETAACFSEAYRRIHADQAIRLCRNGGSLERLVCLESASRQFARCDDAIDQCRSH